MDRCNNFGGRGSPLVWVSFMSLVAWIALYLYLVDDLKTYMDDSFSFEVEGNLLLYEPYGMLFPAKQTRLLQLWDEIGVPHEREKQVFGSPLTVIGFDVDPNAMQVSLPPAKKDALVAELRRFGVSHRRWSLREFRRLAGWCEWSFNVFPLLKPGLSALYAKLAGKERMEALIYVNLAIEGELHWMADWMERADGLLLYRSLDFHPDADGVVVGYTDASSSGMGIWFPEDSFACRSALPLAAPAATIFYFEALAVCSAIHTVADMDPVPSRLLIYTDNTNTVAMFNTLHAQPAYNCILRSAVDVLLQYSVDLRVEHHQETGQNMVLIDIFGKIKSNT